MSELKSSFTKEDLQLVLNIGRQVLEAKFGQFKDALVQNYREAINPDLRLAGRVRAKYDALRSAGMTHDEAVEHTGRLVNRDTLTVLDALGQTEEKEAK